MIVCSAIVINDGASYGDYPIIITGKHHSDCLETARKYGFDRLRCVNALQGFLNSDFRYINRKNAAKEAYDCGQLKAEKNELFSEDIFA